MSNTSSPTYYSSSSSAAPLSDSLPSPISSQNSDSVIGMEPLPLFNNFNLAASSSLDNSLTTSSSSSLLFHQKHQTFNGYPILPSIFPSNTHISSSIFNQNPFQANLISNNTNPSSPISSEFSSISSPPPSTSLESMYPNQFLESASVGNISDSSSEFSSRPPPVTTSPIPHLPPIGSAVVSHHQLAFPHHHHPPSPDYSNIRNSLFYPTTNFPSTSSGHRSPPPISSSNQHRGYEAHSYVAGLGLMAGNSGSYTVDGLPSSSNPKVSKSATTSSSKDTIKKVTGGLNASGTRKAKGGPAKEENKRHACHLCPRAFARPSALNTHMLSHSGEKLLSNLRRHAKMHQKRSSVSAADPPSPSKESKSIKKDDDEDEDEESPRASGATLIGGVGKKEMLLQSPNSSSSKLPRNSSTPASSNGILNSPVEGSFFVSESLYSPHHHPHNLPHLPHPASYPHPQSVSHFTPRNPPLSNSSMLMRYSHQQHQQHQHQMYEYNRRNPETDGERGGEGRGPSGGGMVSY